ncbi:hypothetical protein cyc_08548 [Cyclospora cayetanensis]|uniref:Uncharacterized protein n=1 Tax=Cyclospora cayetanensis TaxID=88456 RepID=A0A1D3D4H0_9EIME|nr:hypothetical protein cyc_08548 [Cyclospora cayetanensis]
MCAIIVMGHRQRTLCPPVCLGCHWGNASFDVDSLSERRQRVADTRFVLAAFTRGSTVLPPARSALAPSADVTST